MDQAPQEPLEPACARFRVRLQDTLDARERADDLARDPHLAGCAACRSDLEALRSLDALLASEPAPEPPADLRAAIVASVRADAARSRRRARVSGLLAAAAIVGLGVAVDLFAGELRTGFDGLTDDARALARSAGGRVDALSLDELPRLELPQAPAIPGAPGPLAPVALATAVGLAAGEVLWWRRARRAGGAA